MSNAIVLPYDILFLIKEHINDIVDITRFCMVSKLMRRMLSKKNKRDIERRMRIWIITKEWKDRDRIKDARSVLKFFMDHGIKPYVDT